MKKVMCIAQSEAREYSTRERCIGGPKFGDICTVVDEKIIYPIGEMFYVFSEYTELDMFQARFFIPVDDDPVNENKNENNERLKGV